MSVTTDYLDKVKEKFELKNNNQLANYLNQHLDTGRQRINNYYNQGTELDMQMCFLIAHLLEIKSDEIIAKISRERAKSGKNKEFWEKKLKGITPCLIYSIVGVMSYYSIVEYYILC